MLNLTGTHQIDTMSAKYDKIGVHYNTTRKADPFLVGKLFEHLSPEADGIYLDVGCGTGNYSIELQKRGVNLIGIDPSERMLEKARSRNDKIDWRQGKVEELELEDKSIDGAIGSLTIHHWSDLQKAFSELHRVIKPGGRLVIFTSTSEQMKGYWLNHYFPKMLSDSIDQMPSYDAIENAMKSGGFEIIGLDNYFISPDLEDKFLYCGKHDPEVYFDEKIRRGISSFSSLANRAEVDEGLDRLRNDIDNGKVWDVIDSFKNDKGDYLYVIARNSQK